MNTKRKKLTLRKETISKLTNLEMKTVEGGLGATNNIRCDTFNPRKCH
ncbi:MAG: hypothetical protein GY757_56650 [bacterium]|nr:hypothetical protein [bacterium]